MEWTRGQAEALRRANRWLQERDKQVFRVFGYAGTGKTTIARHLAENIDGKVMYMAFTGKAALVLRRAGCEGATTIHSTIYNSREKSKQRLRDAEEALMQITAEIRGEIAPDESIDDHPEVQKARRQVEVERKIAAQPAFSLNPESEVKEASLVVVDEVSMVGGQIGSDLLSFDRPVLVLGDPAQLPPVGDGGYFDTEKPDIMLTEVRRNALDNPIIKMATMLRDKQRPELGTYGESSWLPKGKLDADMVMDHEQLIVGRNNTRRASNARFRSLLGRDDPLPVPGDKLVCLRNNHDMGLLNGAIWHCQDRIWSDEDRVGMEIEDEDGLKIEVEAHSQPFKGENVPWWDRKEAQEFDYGNALTCHKAQGSQYNSVLLLNESGCFRKDWWRWLYTGVTRAIDRVTVVEMD